jgi:hypothetical protein
MGRLLGRCCNVSLLNFSHVRKIWCRWRGVGKRDEIYVEADAGTGKNYSETEVDGRKW